MALNLTLCHLSPGGGWGMTIRSYQQSLHLIECGDTRVLYDIHRVKTYDCSIEEAALLCGRDGVTTDHYDKALLSCDQHTLAAIQNRLEHLSGLSKSLSDCQGIVSPFNDHPTLLFMNLCNSCNLQCSYCYAEGCGKKHDPRPMSAETARSGVDFLMQQAKPGEVYVIIFAGGEPLLNFPVLAATASHAREKSRQMGVTLKLRILSNGTVMNAEILKLISEQDIALQLSLDGPPEVHDQYRPAKDGYGSSEKILATIDYLKRNGFTNYKIRSTLCHGNTDTSKITEYFHKQGLENVVLRPIMTSKENSYQLVRSDIAQITKCFDRLCGDIVKNVQTGRHVDIPETFAQYVDKLNIGIKSKRYCGAGRDMVVLSPEGRFYPCPVLADDPQYCTGSLDRGYNGIVEAFPNLSVEEKPVCRQCWARNLCGGGCVSQAIRKNDDPLRPDPLECAATLAKIKGAVVIHHLQKRGGGTIPM